MARHEFPDHPGFELERWMLSRLVEQWLELDPTPVPATRKTKRL